MRTTADAHIYKKTDGRPSIQIVAPLPPSDNHLYFVRGRTKTKTAEARKYDGIIKEAVLQGTLKATSMISFDPNRWHEVWITVHFDRVEAKGWFQFDKKGQRKANHRFFKKDTDNRKKLILDSICEALGIDDTCFLVKHDMKKCDPADPRIYVVIEEYVDQSPL